MFIANVKLSNQHPFQTEAKETTTKKETTPTRFSLTIKVKLQLSQRRDAKITYALLICNKKLYVVITIKDYCIKES